MATLEEEFMAPANQSHIARGKRTKRPRTTSYSPPSPAGITTSISISSGLESFADDDRSSYESAATDEEEEMANCLILLAQGGIKTTSSSNGEEKNDNIIIVENGNSSKVVVVVDPDHTSSFECKTCSKSFHSFQALGGHRASHKKPKSSTTSNNKIIEESKLFNKTNNNDNIFINNPNSPPTIHKSYLPPFSSTSKVHQCSICGSVFSSGQALGGHMRRHRTAPVISSLKPRSILSLDLNLPAPEDDDHFYGEPKFHHQFATNQKRPFAFSAPALVDCHY